MSKLWDLIEQWLCHARRLFHIMVGFAFLFLAMAGVMVSVSEWQMYRKVPSVGLYRFGLLASFTVVLIIFCLYSFAKARTAR